jgi:proliferating cell nuclear antigen PCNA
MTVIFKAKTNCAYTIKVLAELLQNNIKTACFEVDESGIQLCMMDYHKTILIQLKLKSENFTIYKFRAPEKLFVGINLNHFHRMLKSIKKKDSIQLYINDESPTDLAIKVIPKENNRVTTSFIKIQSIQTLEIDIPDGYGKPIIVPSSEYQKMCKDMSHIGNTINVTSKNFHIKFICNAGGVMKRHVEFGEMSDSDEEDEEDVVEREQNFNTEQLSRITKISGLSSNMQIYQTEGLPLLFRSYIGGLGKISIYIKSKDIIDRENQIINSDDDYY